MNRRDFMDRSLRLASLSLAAGLAPAAVPVLRAGAEQDGASGPLEFNTRRRVEKEPGSNQYEAVDSRVRWDPRQTAVIICDMWDKHWCKGATERVAELAPTMDAFVKAARNRGVLIIHAPSSCMNAYKDHPARRRAKEAPRAANLPSEIDQWCNRIPAEEKGKYPIDQSDGGCDCEPRCAEGSPWRRQIDRIEIHDKDALSDSGIEIWNLLEAQGIQNVLIFGVHTNMCVLGRPFGLRQMVKNGKNAVLVRDLTDTMYNSKAWPYVNHFRGTDLIIEHIEKYVCPTTTSASLLGEPAFRFKADPRPHTERLAS